MNYKIPQFIVAILVVTILPLVSAEVVCDDSSVTLNFNTTEIPSGDITITSCQNNGNTTNIDLGGSGVTQYINKGSDQTSISLNGVKNLRLTIDSNIPAGTYVPIFSFQDSSSVVVVVNVAEITNGVEQGDILIFPTSTVVTVQQDKQKTKSILLTVPLSYPYTVNVQSVDFNPGIETIYFDDLDLGLVSPGQTLTIPIIFSAQDAQVGTYTTKLSIFATDSDGLIQLPDISLTLQVTSGVSPVDDTTFSSRPSCALSALSQNLNSTYTFTCSGVVNNLDVNPQYNPFFEGTSVDKSANIYTYTFKPVQFGVTEFLATFSFQGSPIFAPFRQEVRVSASSGQVGGTTLDFLFTPSLSTARPQETVAIQLVDNKTNSLVNNPTIEIDAIPITNRSGNTFFFSFESDKNYTIRGYTAGYSDILKTISLEENQINIMITPEEGNSITQFKITTDINATIYINGDKKGEVYEGTLNAGENIIEAFKAGFTDTSLNFSVESAVIFSTSGEFKKGVSQTVTMNKNATWKLSYQDGVDSPIEELDSGVGTTITFEPTKTGTYIIEAQGSKKTFVLEGFDWNAEWWFMAWYWWIGGVAVLISIFYFRGGSTTTKGVDVGFSGNAQY